MGLLVYQKSLKVVIKKDVIRCIRQEEAMMSIQWAIGTVSMFYWAIGILPFKDGFYSSTNKQTGGASEGPELNPGMT